MAGLPQLSLTPRVFAQALPINHTLHCVCSFILIFKKVKGISSEHQAENYPLPKFLKLFSVAFWKATGEEVEEGESLEGGVLY